MRIVGRYDLRAEFLRQRRKLGQNLGLFGDIVCLHFDVEVFAEELPIIGSALPRRRVVLVHQMLRDFRCETSGRRNQSFRMLREQLMVNSWPVIEPFGIANGREFDQIPISDLVLRQEQQVMSVFAATAARCALFKAIRTDIDFAADNRLHARFVRGVIELDRAEQRSMIGERNRVHAQLFGARDQLVDAAGTVQQAKLGVIMQVNEIGAHRSPSSR